MSKFMKRVISILLAVIMIMVYMPATAFAGNNYDFSDVNLYWRDDYVGAYGYSTIKAEIWYLCQHYYNGNLISSAMCDGDESGYGCWQSIPASKIKEPGKYKLVLSAFSTYNDLHAYESGNLSIKPLYQTSITKDNSTAKRLQTPSKLMWNSDKKTVSWKAVDNAAAYLVDAKKIYKDGHTEDITFDSFPCVIGDDGVSTKDGRVYVNLSKFVEMYSHPPISYSSNVKDVVFTVIAVPDNSGKYFVSKASEKCYFSGQNSIVDSGEEPSDGEVLPLYIKTVGDEQAYKGISNPVGIGMKGIEFYLDAGLVKKISSGIEFPSGGGTFKKNTSGSFDWVNTNATPGNYQIIYSVNGKTYSADLFVYKGAVNNENEMQLYIKIEGEEGPSIGMGCPIGIGISGIDFYLDEELSKRVTSGIEFPRGGGTFKKNTSGSFDWDNTNATPGTYQILYSENGKQYVANLYVDKATDNDNDSEDDGEENEVISLNDCSISSITKSYTYTGKAIKLKIKIVDPAGEELIEGQDYKITYKNNIELGKGTATVKGIGKYQGSIPITMTIKLKTPVISTLDRNYSKLTVKWGEVAGAAGYQIRYSANSDMSNSTYKNVTGASKLSATISSLKGNKKYYARVRAYYVKNNKKIYSNWSDTKSIYVPGHNAVYTESGWKTMKTKKYSFVYDTCYCELGDYYYFNLMGQKSCLNATTDASKGVIAEYDFAPRDETYTDQEKLYFISDDYLKQGKSRFIVYDIATLTYEEYYFADDSEYQNGFTEIIDFYDGKFYINTGSRVLTFDINSRKISDVFTTKYDVFEHQISDNGRYIYYCSDDPGFDIVYIYDKQKHKAVKTITCEYEGFKSQGNSIFYIKGSDSSKTYKIYQAKADGSNAKVLLSKKMQGSNLDMILVDVTSKYIYYDIRYAVVVYNRPNIFKKHYKYNRSNKAIKYLGE